MLTEGVTAHIASGNYEGGQKQPLNCVGRRHSYFRRSHHSKPEVLISDSKLNPLPCLFSKQGG